MDFLPFTLQLFAEPGRSQASEVALIIGLPCFLAVALFGFGFSKEKDGGKPWVKYLAFVPLALAAWIGYPYFEYARDPFAKSAGMIGGKSEIAYLGAFLVPVGLMVLFGVAAYFIHRWISNEARF